jgi:predicted amidohydrolase
VFLGGSLLLRQSGHVYNTFVLAAPDGQLYRYRQRHLFLWERCYFEAGRQPLIAETALGRLGLLVCRDVAQPAAWAAYAGRVDAVLIASAPPRFHRAVLNFPGARKAYLAQLMPALVRARDQLDRLYSAHVAACAAAQGVPVTHAVMAGRFVSHLPFPRLSLLSAAWPRPRYWPLVGQAPVASMRATFYGGSAVYDGQGATLPRVDGDEGVAQAEIALSAGPRPSGPVPRPGLPAGLRLLELVFRPSAAWAYRRSRVA